MTEILHLDQKNYDSVSQTPGAVVILDFFAAMRYNNKDRNMTEGFSWIYPDWKKRK